MTTAVANALEERGLGLVVELAGDAVASLRELIGIFVLLAELAGGAFRFLLGG